MNFDHLHQKDKAIAEECMILLTNRENSAFKWRLFLKKIGDRVQR